MKKEGVGHLGRAFAQSEGLSLGRDGIIECEKQCIRVYSGSVGYAKIPLARRNTNIFTSTGF